MKRIKFLGFIICFVFVFQFSIVKEINAEEIAESNEVVNFESDEEYLAYYKEAYNSGKITLEEYEEVYSEYSKKYVSISERETISTFDSRSVSSETTIEGRLYFKVNNNLTVLRNTRVRIYLYSLSEPDLIKEAYTDFSGDFCFELSSEETAYTQFSIYIHAESYTVKVYNLSLHLFNYVASNRISFAQNTNNAFEFEVVGNSSPEILESFSVLQGMVVGEMFALEQGMTTTKKLSVLYPYTTKPNLESFSYDVICGIAQKDYNIIDALIHEYGHFVQHCYDNYPSDLLDMLLNDPKHSFTAVHFEDKQSKDYAMELAWTEAWSDVFAEIAQKYYIFNYTNTYNNFGDCEHKSRDLDTPVVSDDFGESQEYAVSAFLWDLFDLETGNYSIGTIEEDYVLWGPAKWWDYTIEADVENLTEFIVNAYQALPNERSNIGKLLEAACIAPGNLIASNTSLTQNSQLTLSWQVNGSNNYANNQFDILFYNSNDVLLGYIDSISVTGIDNRSNYSYTVSTTFWKQMFASYDPYEVIEIYVVVRGYHSGTPISGPYHSAFLELTVTIAHTHSYTHQYISMNDGGQHMAMCSCGLYVVQSCRGIMSASGTVCNKCGQTLGGFIIGSVSNDILYLGKDEIPFS